MSVRLLDPVLSFKDFIADLKKRSAVRLVRLTDYGLVEPAKRHNAFVMQPMVRVTATAFDREAEEIVRYVEQKDADQMVTVIVGSEHGRHNDIDMVARKSELKTLLLDEGFQVEDGEWTPRSAEAFLETRKKAYG